MDSEHSSWAPGRVGFEGQRVVVGGINPWDFEWILLDEPIVKLPHPSYSHELHKFWLYRVEAEGREVVLAAGELSANVWGFYERVA